MAKVGINAFLWTARWDADPSPVLNRAKTLGFDAVQIPILDLASFDFRAMQKAVEELGLDCYVSAGLKDHMDVTSEDAEPRRLGVEHLKGCVRIAAQMGSPFLSGSFHSVFGKKPDGPVYMRHWERSAECLRQVAVEAQRHNLCLALEPINRYESFLINTAEQARRLIGLIDEPNMRVQLDTFHMNLEEDNPAESIRAAGADMVHFHVAESHRGRFGRGTMRWDEIFAALVDIDYRGALIIETFVPEVSEVAVAAGIWRKMAPSGDALAREGLAFVRALANKYAL